VGRRSAEKATQLAAAEKAAENYIDTYSQRISDSIVRVGDCVGGVPSVRAAGPSAPTGVSSLAGPVLERRYGLRRLVETWVRHYPVVSQRAARHPCRFPL
jgi:hypothetical protein